MTGRAGQGRLFPMREPRGRTRRSSDVTLKALRELGRLSPLDEALVVAHRVAADNVDAAERARIDGEGTSFVVGNAIRTYLAASHALYVRVGMLVPGDDDDEWGPELAELSAQVGDAASA